jgi:hypothetical protein
MFSATLIPANRPRPCGTYDTPRRVIDADEWPVRDSPASMIRPARGGDVPTIVFSRVDLPAPLRPSSATISWRWTSNDTPLRI